MNFMKPEVLYLQKMMNFMKVRTFYKRLPLFIKNSILHTYKKIKPQIWAFIKNSIFGTFCDPCHDVWGLARFEPWTGQQPLKVPHQVLLYITCYNIDSIKFLPTPNGGMYTFTRLSLTAQWQFLPHQMEGCAPLSNCHWPVNDSFCRHQMEGCAPL